MYTTPLFLRLSLKYGLEPIGHAVVIYRQIRSADPIFILGIHSVQLVSSLRVSIYRNQCSWNRLRLRSSANIGEASTFTHSAVIFFKFLVLKALDPD